MKLNRSYNHVRKEHVTSFEGLRNYKAIAVDLETTGLNPRQDSIVGLSFAVDDYRGYYITDKDLINQFAKDVLEYKVVAKVFHNAVFDLSMLKQKGYTVAGDIHDTMVLAHLYDPDRSDVGLKYLASETWGPEAVAGDVQLNEWLTEHGLDKGQLHHAPQDILTKYAAEDAINTYGLFKLFYDKIFDLKEWLNVRRFKRTPWEYYKEEYMPLFRVVVDMQLNGVRLDLNACSTMQSQLEERVKALDVLLREQHKEQIIEAEKLLLEKKIAQRKKANKSGEIKKIPKTPTLNWDSNDHLKTLLFKVYKLSVTKKTKKGNISLDAAFLETLLEPHPWAQTLLEYKEIKKALGMYFRFNPKKRKGKPLLMAQENGNIHASFNIIGTATGRFSSSNPNLQNLPKHGGIKSLFVPRQGKTFVYADYSQLELRIAAHLSQDQILLRAYRDGLDLHQETATAIKCSRDEGKRINFAIIYNAGGWRIAEILGLMEGLPLCPSPVRDWKCECAGCVGRKEAMEKGTRIIKKLFGKYAGLKKYVDEKIEEMLKYKLSVSEFGRIRRLKHLGNDITRMSREERLAHNHDIKAGFNLPIQSFGASLCKRAMIALHTKGYNIINQIHDSLLIEVPQEDYMDRTLQEVKGIMENVYKLSVPLLVEPKILTSFEEKGK